MSDGLMPAVLLAAGEGRRLGEPKALVEIGGETLLERVARECRAAGFTPRVAVVPTSLRAEIERSHANLDTALDNPEPESGPLRSLHIAMEVLPSDTSGMLLTKVDFAMVRSATYVAVAASVRRDPTRLWRPVHEGRHGHPVWMPAALFGALLEAPMDQGARAVVYAHQDLWGDVSVDDPWILRDIDRPEDLALARSEASPTK